MPSSRAVVAAALAPSPPGPSHRAFCRALGTPRTESFPPKMNYCRCEKLLRGWREEAVVKALASHTGGPGSSSAPLLRIPPPKPWGPQTKIIEKIGNSKTFYNLLTLCTRMSVIGRAVCGHLADPHSHTEHGTDRSGGKRAALQWGSSLWPCFWFQTFLTPFCLIL